MSGAAAVKPLEAAAASSERGRRLGAGPRPRIRGGPRQERSKPLHHVAAWRRSAPPSSLDESPKADAVSSGDSAVSSTMTGPEPPSASFVSRFLIHDQGHLQPHPPPVVVDVKGEDAESGWLLEGLRVAAQVPPESQQMCVTRTAPASRCRSSGFELLCPSATTMLMSSSKKSFVCRFSTSYNR